ncbi:hypothetical protein DFJ74DRAFT_444087 [Hyaloraphidium curvatum]|nr:hypothetical protein DFJ74DRAFT_444087 [Hyaloraphidium curvatum]
MARPPILLVLLLLAPAALAARVPFTLAPPPGLPDSCAPAADATEAVAAACAPPAKVPAPALSKRIYLEGVRAGACRDSCASAVEKYWDKVVAACGDEELPSRSNTAPRVTVADAAAGAELTRAMLCAKDADGGSCGPGPLLKAAEGGFSLERCKECEAATLATLDGVAARYPDATPRGSKTWDDMRARFKGRCDKLAALWAARGSKPSGGASVY